MATRYWYVANNGSNNWNSSNWYPQSGGGAGASTLAATDDGVLDVNSGTGTITVSGTVTCNSLDATTFIGTLAGVSQITIVNQTTRGPSASTPLLAWGSGMTLSHTGTVLFSGTTGLGGFIFCNGQTFKGPVGFNNTAVGCTFTLKDTFSTLSTSLTLTSGAVIAEADVIVGTFAYGTGTKSFTCENLFLIGTGTLTSGTTSANSISSIANIIVNNGSATAKSLTLGTTFGSANVELGGTGPGSLTMIPGSTFRPNVNVTNTGGATLSFNTGAITDLIFAPTTTIIFNNIATQTLTIGGNLTFTPLQPVLVRTPALLFNQPTSSQITMAGKVLVTGAITVNNPGAGLEFLDEFNCPLIALQITDSGSVNMFENFTCASIVNGLTSYLFIIKNLTCGSISITGTSVLFIGNTSNYNNIVTATTISLSGAGGSPLLQINTGTFNCTTITMTTAGAIVCQTINSNFPVTVNCSSVAISGLGELIISSNLSNTPTIFNCAGAFLTTNGNFSIQKSEAYFTTFTLSGANSSAAFFELGLLYLSGTGTAFSVAATSNAGSSTNSKIEFTNPSNTAITFGGGSHSYYEVVFNRGGSTATNTISGSNGIVNFRDLGTAAHTISFGGGTTQYIGHFDVHGSPGNVITLTRSSNTATYVSKSGRGVVICDYVAVTNLFTDDINTWYAGPNSTVTNSANWVLGGRVRNQGALGVG